MDFTEVTNDNDTENFIAAKCVICFEEFFEKAITDHSKLYKKCCKYLHSAIAKLVENEDHAVSYFCNTCLESAVRLSGFTDQLEVFQKIVSEFILIFSLEILQRRANVPQNGESNDTGGSNLALCDLTGLQCRKPAVSQEKVPTFQPPLSSEQQQFPIFENRDREQEHLFVVPLITSVQSLQSNSESIPSTTITFENIIKTESSESWISDNNSCAANQIQDIRDASLDNISPSFPQIVPDGTAFVKLKRFGLPIRNMISLEPEDEHFDNILRTNRTECAEIPDNPKTLDEKHNQEIQIVKTSTIISTNNPPPLRRNASLVRGVCKTSQQMLNPDSDPHHQTSKTTCKTPVARMKFGKHRSNYSLRNSTKTGKALRCNICQKSFNKHSALQTHIQASHEKTNQLNCSVSVF